MLLILRMTLVFIDVLPINLHFSCTPYLTQEWFNGLRVCAGIFLSLWINNSQPFHIQIFISVPSTKNNVHTKHNCMVPGKVIAHKWLHRRNIWTGLKNYKMLNALLWNKEDCFCQTIRTFSSKMIKISKQLNRIFKWKFFLIH